MTASSSPLPTTTTQILLARRPTGAPVLEDFRVAEAPLAPLADGQLRYTPDVTREPAYVPGLFSGAEVDVPLRASGEVFGVLVVESREPNAFGHHDLEILTAAAQQAGIALARIRLLEEMHRMVDAERRRADEREALLDTITDLSTELELSRLLEAVLSRAVT